jgi:Ribonuclease toxin, BrnT, of type II toxin-antitoxin system
MIVSAATRTDWLATKLRQRITVPSEVMGVLRWHLATQLTTPEQKASELLFPAEDGAMRSVSFQKKAFATIGALIGLKKRITPRAMRRTFNDLARAANVEAIITKSISGHQTDRMREHYSTVTPDAQRRSIGNKGRFPGADGARPRDSVRAVGTVRVGEFEWDEAKARANVRKHGVTFEEAMTIFLDELAVPFEEGDHADRLVQVGESQRRGFPGASTPRRRGGPSRSRSSSRSCSHALGARRR